MARARAANRYSAFGSFDMLSYHREEGAARRHATIRARTSGFAALTMIRRQVDFAFAEAMQLCARKVCTRAHWTIPVT